MKKLLNRRVVGIYLHEEEVISPLLERIDNCLLEVLFFRKSMTEYVIYKNLSQKILIGYEVVGADNSLQHHNDIVVQDFEAMCFMFEKIAFSSLQELFKKIRSYPGVCRVVSTSKYNEFEIYREKNSMR